VPQFRRKPLIVTLVEFQPDRKPWPINVVGNLGTCSDEDEEVYSVWNECHGHWITIEPGDWISIDDPNDTYPIKADIVEKNFEPVETP